MSIKRLRLKKKTNQNKRNSSSSKIKANESTRERGSMSDDLVLYLVKYHRRERLTYFKVKHISQETLRYTILWDFYFWSMEPCSTPWYATFFLYVRYYHDLKLSCNGSCVSRVEQHRTRKKLKSNSLIKKTSRW